MATIPSGTSGETVSDQLVRQFCPPLDSALVHALLLDLPSAPSQDEIKAINSTLSSLASDAEIQSTPDHEDDGTDETGASTATTTTTTTTTDTTSTLAEDLDLGKTLEVWSLNGDESSTTQGTTPSNRTDSERSSYRPDDPLAFLSSVFPNESIELLQQHLESSLGDVEVVVDELLSSGLLKEAQREEEETPLPPSTLDSPVASKQQRKRIKAAQKASSTLSLTSTPHLALHSPALSAASYGSAPSSPIIAARPIENRWASISSHASNLASLLHVAESRIVSTYHKSSSSLPLTLARLLHALTAERPFDSLSNEDEQSPIDLRDSLGAVLPHLTEERLEMLLSSTEGDVADAMDLEATIQEIEKSEGRLVWSEILQLESTEPQLTKTGPTFSSTSSTTPIPIAVVPNSRIQAVVQGKERYTFKECSTLELEYLHKRNLALRSAATHFQKGGIGERGAAFYWAEESRKLDAKRKVWTERKAVALVRERALKDGMGGGRGVDLHGLTMNEAMAVTRDSLDEWWRVNHGALSPSPLRIITGVGKHSTNQVAILLPAVIKLLDKEGWSWSYDNSFGGAGARGAVLVKGRK